MRRALLYLLVCVVVIGLVRALIAQPGKAPAAVFAWLLMGYIFVRALPGIRRDLVRLPRPSLRPAGLRHRFSRDRGGF